LRFSYKIVPNADKGFGNSGVQYQQQGLRQLCCRWLPRLTFEAGKHTPASSMRKNSMAFFAQRGQKTTVKTVDGKTRIEGDRQCG